MKGKLALLSAALAALCGYAAYTYSFKDSARSGHSSIPSESVLVPDGKSEASVKPRNLSQTAAVGAVAGNEVEGSSYKETSACVAAGRRVSDLDLQLKTCELHPNDKEFYDSCKERTKGFEPIIAASMKKLDSCVTSDIEELESRFFHETVSAAKKGDADAQMCYVENNFMVPNSRSKEEYAEYVKLADQYIDSAIMRGDWRVVNLMMLPPSASPHSSGRLHSLPGRDPATRYKMNRLARLGAIGRYADKLDIVVEDSKSDLSAAEIAKAEAWARKTYEAYFKNSPKLESEVQVCSAG
jgi:hypothetical protein